MSIIITGGNRGLGYETAKQLATLTDQTVILACRDMESGEKAAEEILSDSRNGRVIARHLDLASLQSVREFATGFKRANHAPLTSLICNAGVSKTTVQQKSIDGYELTFAINHLGHFLLTHLLLSHMAKPGRILVVSSGAHDPGAVSGPMMPPRYVNAKRVAFPERDPDRPKDDGAAGGEAYATSKLCNMLFLFELARRLKMNGIDQIFVNGFSPGLMAGTGLGREGKGMIRFMWYFGLPLMRPLMGNISRTVRQSGSDLVWLVLAPELNGVTSTYFDGREEKVASAVAQDPAIGAELWASSVEMVGLKPEETLPGLM